jgi:hypothetical protein
MDETLDLYKKAIDIFLYGIASTDLVNPSDRQTKN